MVFLQKKVLKLLFTSVDDFQIVDITADANALIQKIQDTLSKLPSAAATISVDAVISQIEELENELYNNFLIDSLPYLLGEDYRKEHLATMFHSIKSALRSTEPSRKDAEDADHYLNPLDILGVQINSMRTILASKKHTPQIAGVITNLTMRP